MKAKLLSIVAILILSSVSIFAQDVATYSNINKTEQGCVKEYIDYDTDSSTPIKKKVYIEDVNGHKVSQTTYKWRDNNWEAIQQVNYMFNEANQTTVLIYSKWDDKRNNWSGKGEFYSYRYNNDGELLASVQVPMTDGDNLITIAK